MMEVKRVLITGINGYISQYLLNTQPENVRIIGSTRRNSQQIISGVSQQIKLDLTLPIAPQLDVLEEIPHVVIHTAAMSSLALCERESDLALQVNAKATGQLAQWCTENNVRLIYLSTDIVFKGDKPPYDEASKPDPVNQYGFSKWQGEIAIQNIMTDFAIGRIALALAPGLNGTRNFIDWFLERLSSKQEIPLFTDEIRTPTFTPELAKRFWQLALSKETGIFHVCGAQAIDRYQLGRALCDALGEGHDLLKPISLKQMTDYPRPVDVSLVSTRKLANQPFKIPSILNFISELTKKV